MTIREHVLEYIQRKDYTPKTKEELATAFDIEVSEFREFFRVIKDMEKERLISFTKKEKIIFGQGDFLIRGTLQGHRSGDFCYLLPEDKELGDVYISKENLNGAIHKDQVEVEVIQEKKDSRNAEGKVVNMLTEKRDPIVGTFQAVNAYGFIVPDDNKYGFDLFIRAGDKNGAKNEDKAIARIDNTNPKEKNPTGVVLEVLGNKDIAGIDITSVVKDLGIPDVFSKKVLDQAAKVPQEVEEKEKHQRVDYRDLFTVTIDGEDAKDFDDAISIDKKEDGYVLYVHIADVAHYVDKGTALDKEAYRRGNSVYLLDRVIPMLPFELSNGICSLNPDVERLALTVKMLINTKGKVIDYKFQETLIRSNHRLVYTNVSDYLEGKYSYEDKELESKLDIMKELFEILAAKRSKRGSIDFDFTEVKILMNKEGSIKDIVPAERRIGNRLIEEFMLVTNETVAAHYGFLEQTFMYRVHGDPDEEKVEAFRKFITNFGYRIKGKDIHSKDFQALLQEAKGKPEEILIQNLLLRSMQKAEYSEEPDKHFGLSTMFYSHFTSPIRRYPDLFIHRIVKNTIHHRPDTKNEKAFLEYTAETADHCSITERRADEAEREVNDMKMAEFMEDHIGETFEGIISSVTGFGIFVQLPNTIEGMVQYADLKDDYYHFDSAKYQAVGERSHKVYRIGQPVKVKVTDASKERREIDFIFVENGDEDVKE